MLTRAAEARAAAAAEAAAAQAQAATAQATKATPASVAAVQHRWDRLVAAAPWQPYVLSPTRVEVTAAAALWPAGGASNRLTLSVDAASGHVTAVAEGEGPAPAPTGVLAEARALLADTAAPGGVAPAAFLPALAARLRWRTAWRRQGAALAATFAGAKVHDAGTVTVPFTRFGASGSFGEVRREN